MKQKNLSTDQVKNIGDVLGKEISDAHFGDVRSFAEFSKTDLADFRLLETYSSVLTLKYIRFRLMECVTLQEAASFRWEVVVQGTFIEE